MQRLLEQMRFHGVRLDGRLTKLIGDEDHPYAQGKLCARGYGYSQIAYSKDRLTDPLKKNDKAHSRPSRGIRPTARSPRR